MQFCVVRSTLCTNVFGALFSGQSNAGLGQSSSPGWQSVAAGQAAPAPLCAAVSVHVRAQDAVQALQLPAQSPTAKPIIVVNTNGQIRSIVSATVVEIASKSCKNAPKSTIKFGRPSSARSPKSHQHYLSNMDHWLKIYFYEKPQP